MTDYIRLDRATLDRLPDEDAYRAAGTIVDQAKALASAYQDEIAARLAAEHSPSEAARMLDVSPSLITKRTNRHEKRLLMSDGTQLIASNNHRGHHATYPLLERVQAIIPDADQAHEAIHAHLEEIIQLDGEDAVILGRTPLNPRAHSAAHRPADLDRHAWLQISDETADAILGAVEHEAQNP